MTLEKYGSNKLTRKKCDVKWGGKNELKYHMDNKQQNEVTWSNELVRDNANKDAKRELDTNANWRRLVKPKTMNHSFRGCGPQEVKLGSPSLQKGCCPKKKTFFAKMSAQIF